MNYGNEEEAQAAYQADMDAQAQYEAEAAAAQAEAEAQEQIDRQEECERVIQKLDDEIDSLKERIDNLQDEKYRVYKMYSK